MDPVLIFVTVLVVGAVMALKTVALALAGVFCAVLVTARLRGRRPETTSCVPRNERLSRVGARRQRPSQLG